MTSTVIINSEVMPPTAPGHSYAQWLRDWIPTQPKLENREVAKNTIKRGAQTWNMLPEYEKQVCILIVMCPRSLNPPVAIPREGPYPIR
jgi:hypothetical protein